LGGLFSAFAQSTSIPGYDYWSGASYAQMGGTGALGFASIGMPIPTNVRNVSPDVCSECTVLRFAPQSLSSNAVNAAFQGNDNYIRQMTSDTNHPLRCRELFSSDIASYGKPIGLGGWTQLY